MKYNYSAHNQCIFLLSAPSTLPLIKFNLVFALQDSTLINHLNLLLFHQNCHNMKQLITFLVLILTCTAENEWHQKLQVELQVISSWWPGDMSAVRTSNTLSDLESEVQKCGQTDTGAQSKCWSHHSFTHLWQSRCCSELAEQVWWSQFLNFSSSLFSSRYLPTSCLACTQCNKQCPSPTSET